MARARARQPVIAQMRGGTGGRAARAVRAAGLVLIVAPAAGCDDARSFAGRTSIAPQYVGSESCAGCHLPEYTAWLGSDHQLAMGHATSATVLGDFDDATFVDNGVETFFFRRDHRFFARTAGPSGAIDTLEVRYTFGVRPLQQYLVEFPDGRVQALTVAWDTEAKRWFSLHGDEPVATGEWQHWTGGAMNWNAMCADCHTTDLRQNYDLATNRFRTTFGEVNVSCESCHGPASEHAAWASRGSRRVPPRLGLTVRLSPRHAADAEIETCAVCHSVRQPIAAGFVPGARLLDHYTPLLLDAPHYFADGQIDEEVFEYGSFLQSRMYAAGVRCTSCHEPHSGRTRLEGNSLCTQCHVPAAYDTPTHHDHAPGSDAAACVTCHMPERLYMQVDWRRDHSFKVPRPDLSADLGTPNVCSRCHTDRPAEWARDRIIDGYGERPRVGVDAARAIAAGRMREAGADDGLAAVARDPTASIMTRATAMALLQAYATPAADAARAVGLRDVQPLMRIAAVRSFEERTDRGLVAALVPLLSDSVRAVRLEAARLLARVADDELLRSRRVQREFRAVRAEYRESLRLVEHQPEAHLNLAVLAENLGDHAGAERAYHTALRLDSTFAPAHLNLAMLFDRRRATAARAGRVAEALPLRQRTEMHLRAALRLDTLGAEAPFSLGLLLAEDASRLEESADLLDMAARRAPRQSRIRYNAGLAQQHLGRPHAAEPHLLAASALEPENSEFLNALAILYMQQQRWADALAQTQRLIAVHAGVPALMQRRDYIQAQLR